MLSERLLAVKNAVMHSDKTLDVGTDHGYVPISLVREKRAKKVIASDINEGPLLNAKKNIIKSGYKDQIELRLGSGIETVKENEVDTCIIAGMGGVLISEILDTSDKTARTIDQFILQPMNSQDYLRKYLIQNGYSIVLEYLAGEKDKIYNILKVVPKIQEPYQKEIDYQIGAIELFENLDKHLFHKYLKKKEKQVSDIIKNLSDAEKDVSEELLFYQNLKEELLCLNAKK